MPAGGDDLRVELDRDGLHLEALRAEARDRRRAEAELHGAQPSRRGVLAGEQPHHHAAHVLELDDEGVADAHGALDPRRAQVQVADAARFRDRDLGQRGRERLRHGALSIVAASRGNDASALAPVRSRRLATSIPRSAASSAPMRGSSALSLRMPAPTARAAAVW